MKRQVFTLVLAVLCLHFSFGQCDLKDNNVFDKVEPDAHPYTTFYRAASGGIFSYNGATTSQLGTFRSQLAGLLVTGELDDKKSNTYERITYDVYVSLFDDVFEVPIGFANRRNDIAKG